MTGSWTGTVDTLDGTVSCSVVIDPDVVRRTFQSDGSWRGARSHLRRRILGHGIHS